MMGRSLALVLVGYLSFQSMVGGEPTRKDISDSQKRVRPVEQIVNDPLKKQVNLRDGATVGINIYAQDPDNPDDPPVPVGYLDLNLINQIDTLLQYPGTTNDTGYAAISDIPLGVDTGHEVMVPDKTRVGNNYPNPFNPHTTIPYELSERAKVLMEIFNVAGQHVITLVDENKSPGVYTVQWDAKNKFEQNVAEGVYIARIISQYANGNKEVDTEKMIFLRKGVPVSRGSPGNLPKGLAGAETQDAEFTDITRDNGSVYDLVTANSDLTNPAIIDTTFEDIEILGDTSFTFIVEMYKLPKADINGKITADGLDVANAGVKFVNQADTLLSYATVTSDSGTYNIFQIPAEQLYEMRLSNTDSTLPQILDTLFNDIYVNADTTIDKSVERVLFPPVLGELSDITINEDGMTAGDIVQSLAGLIDDPDSPYDSLDVDVYSSNSGLANFSVDDSLNVILDSLQLDGYGNTDVTVRVTDETGSFDEQSFSFNVNEMDDLRGTLYNIMTQQGMQGRVEVDGAVYGTDSLGYFNIQVDPGASHSLRGQGFTNDIKTTYLRTRAATTGNQDLDNIMVKLTPLLPDSAGVSELEFYNFAEEANFQESYFPAGLSKIDFNNAQHPDSGFVYWIAKISPFNGNEFTDEEQLSVYDFIMNNVLADVPDDMKPDIHLADTTDTIPYPLTPPFIPTEYGMAIVIPRRITNPGIVTYDENNDGILENANITLNDGNEQTQVVQESLSWLIAPYEVQNSLPPDKTVLHRQTGVNTMQPADNLLLAIALAYQPLTQIDDVLNTGQLSEPARITNPNRLLGSGK